MKNAAVTKIVAFLWRKQLSQRKLHLIRVFRFDKTEQIRNADKVGVGNNGRLAVNIAAYEVCRFSADSGQGGQVLDIVRNPSAEIGKDFLRHSDNVLRLGAIEAAGAHKLLHIGNIGIGKGFNARIFLKKRWLDKVHPCVGALGRKPCCNKKLKIVLVIKGTNRLGILFF